MDKNKKSLAAQNDFAQRCFVRSEYFIKNKISLIELGIENVASDIPAGYSNYTFIASFLIPGSTVLVQQYIWSNANPDVYYRVIGTDGSTVYRNWAIFISNKGHNSPENKWYVLGDSISAGYFSITDEEAAEKGYTISYRPSDYGYPVYDVGSVWMSDLSHNYWGYANKWFLHRNLQPNAYPGQGFLKKASNNQNGIDKVKALTIEDGSLITVAWGFNDWHYDQPRGDHNLIDASVPYPTSGYDTSQITTVNQAIWFCLGELIRKAPNATIIVQTPMNGWLYGGDWDSDWGLGYAMEHSGTLKDIHDDIVYWAEYYGLQVLDMTYNNSTVNRRNIQDVLIDGSHPSDPAHMQLGRKVATMMNYV